MKTYLNAVSRHLPGAIVDDRARARLAGLAGQLPHCSLAALEVRLDEDPTVDFLVRLAYENPRIPESFLDSPVWQRIQHACDRIRTPEDPLHDRVERFFLEFDLDRPQPAIPIPGLFAQLREGAFLAPGEIAHIAQALFPRYVLAPGLQACIERCTAALPAAAEIAHLGAMLSRPDRALRVVVHHLPLHAAARYLDAIGWIDRGHGLARLLDDVADHVDGTVMLDLDLADDIGAKVGVEVFLRGDDERLERWDRFLQHLVALRCCTQEKASALLAWPGFAPAEASGDPCDTLLGRGNRLLSRTAVGLFWRNLNHVKFAYAPGLPIRAKGYLGFGHNWFPRTEVPRAARTAVAGV